ncbi:MAG: hypothetical protein JXJ04_14920 [Spirochaetales bacterium]|nr:hypothetical protein [Spirochaetales bacterium]
MEKFEERRRKSNFNEEPEFVGIKEPEVLMTNLLWEKIPELFMRLY